MTRATAIAAIALFALAAPATAQVTGTLSTRPVPTLRAAVTVTSDVVRIGDMIENAGGAANVAIFRSPDAGTSGTVPVSMVLDAIRAHDLLVVDTRDLTAVEVTRAGRTIGVKELQERIARAFASRQNLGDANNLSVMLDGEARPIRIDASASADLLVRRANYDAHSGRFDITFDVAGDGRAGATQVRLTGRLVEMVDVAILMRAVARGDALHATDVAIERRPRSEVPGEIVGSLAQAVGLAARQNLRAGLPLHRSDLMQQDLVRRDEPVTLIYESPGLTLTMRGKAVDSGTDGDLVNVTNVQTKRNVQGYVSGPGRVTIPSTGAGPVAQTAAATERPARQTVE